MGQQLYGEEGGMNKQRRTVLKTGSSLGLAGLLASLGLLTTQQAWADWNKAAFDAQTLSDALKALGVVAVPAASSDILMTIPDVVEDGALVPVAVESRIANTRMLSLLVEKNPNALAASFTFPEGTEPYLATRLKMDQSCDVLALVKTDDGFFMARQMVIVIQGGCGG